MKQLRLPYAEILFDEQLRSERERKNAYQALALIFGWILFLGVMFRVQLPVYCDYCHQVTPWHSCLAEWLYNHLVYGSDNTYHWDCFWKAHPIPRDPRPN